MSDKNTMVLRFNDFKFESVNDEHINKMPFSGVCLKVDTPSDGIPCGANKSVKFTKEAIEKALPTFVGMGVNCEYNSYDFPDEVLTGHNARFKIGTVDSAELTDNGVVIKGNLWQHDFYDVCFMIKNAKDSLGFSVEVFVEDMIEENDCYCVTDFTFTGVAILYKNLAAFKDTQLQAQRKKEVDSKMDEKQFNEFMAKFSEMNEKFDKVSETIECANNAIEKLQEKVTELENKEIDFSAVNEKIEGIEAKFEEQKAIPTPKTKDNFVGKDEHKEISFAEKRKEIMNDVSIPEHMKAQACVKAYAEMLYGNKD